MDSAPRASATDSTGTTSTNGNGRRGLIDLARVAVEDTVRLVQQEIQLAKIEIREMLSSNIKAAIFLGAAGLCALLFLVMLLVTIALWIPNHTLAALVETVVFLVLAAILGLDDADIEQACRDAAQGAVVEPVNFNAPGQVVIAGQSDAVQRAIEAAKSRGAKRAIALPVSVPSHSSLMRGAAQRLGERLKTVEIRAPRIRYVSAVDAASHDGPSDIRELLVLTLSRMGVDADTASTFKEAQEALKLRPYDLALTDMRLPDGDGLMVLGPRIPNQPCPTLHGLDVIRHRFRHRDVEHRDR